MMLLEMVACGLLCDLRFSLLSGKHVGEEVLASTVHRCWAWQETSSSGSGVDATFHIFTRYSTVFAGTRYYLLWFCLGFSHFNRHKMVHRCVLLLTLDFEIILDSRRCCKEEGSCGSLINPPPTPIFRNHNMLSTAGTGRRHGTIHSTTEHDQLSFVKAC